MSATIFAWSIGVAAKGAGREGTAILPLQYLKPQIQGKNCNKQIIIKKIAITWLMIASSLAQMFYHYHCLHSAFHTESYIA
jgi:hypothetical protein